MRGRSGSARGNARRARRVAALLWLSFAFVVWNVVFDRQLFVDASRFATESVVRHQQGIPLRTIDGAYRPAVRVAALRATLCAGMVLAVGALGMWMASPGLSSPDDTNGSIREPVRE